LEYFPWKIKEAWKKYPRETSGMTHKVLEKKKQKEVHGGRERTHIVGHRPRK